MNIEQLLCEDISSSLTSLFKIDTTPTSIAIEQTRKEFIGNYTLVVFPFVRFSKLSPESTAEAIGEYLVSNSRLVEKYQVVKGFLNLSLHHQVWSTFLIENRNNTDYGRNEKGKNQRVMVEYSSPNTNKPLHLGHIRNNLLGYAIAQLLDFNGYEVIKTNLVNDRGIHICKSMLAWKKFGMGETPESSGLKGDHLVGKYYVEFDKRYKEELSVLQSNGLSKEEAENASELMKEAREMLILWENNDEETIALWQKMNAWVYKGFDATYQSLGVDFDHYYYESNTYKLGKEIVKEGLEKGVFYKENDQSVWIDLSQEKLDKKLLLRSDGTSVYMTQDLGTADLKYSEFKIDKSIYVVGNEQDYHFQVLFKILEKLDKPYAKGMYHLSYGMVDLPSGKMKSREGTVVDADDLIAEMIHTAQVKSTELGKTEGLSADEKSKLYAMLGLAALKFYILKVDPVKRMVFNPEESIDFQGDTGSFVQYTYARIRSILRNIDTQILEEPFDVSIPLHDTELETLFTLYLFESEVKKASDSFNPSLIAAYCLRLAKSFNKVYKEVSFLRESNMELKNRRLQLAQLTAITLKNAMGILGIEMPERM
jgi:arginyl-tRNA synthetase